MEWMAFFFFADDCQIYLPIANIDETKTKVVALLSDIKTWMRERKLLLNERKPEIMLINPFSITRHLKHHQNKVKVEGFCLNISYLA